MTLSWLDPEGLKAADGARDDHQLLFLSSKSGTGPGGLIYPIKRSWQRASERLGIVHFYEWVMRKKAPSACIMTLHTSQNMLECVIAALTMHLQL